MKLLLLEKDDMLQLCFTDRIWVCLKYTVTIRNGVFNKYFKANALTSGKHVHDHTFAAEQRVYLFNLLFRILFTFAKYVTEADSNF